MLQVLMLAYRGPSSTLAIRGDDREPEEAAEQQHRSASRLPDQDAFLHAPPSCPGTSTLRRRGRGAQAAAAPLPPPRSWLPWSCSAACTNVRPCRGGCPRAA